jgi:hypothetical protein
VTGILAANEHSDLKDSCSPNCSDDQISNGKTLAWVSTGLTAAAAVGVGVGVVLLVMASPSKEPQAKSSAPSLKPHVDVAIEPHRAGAQATWRF